MNYKPSKPMTYAKAKEILKREFYNSDFNEEEVWNADGFIQGWDARMKYEAEINGKLKDPKEPKE